VTLQAKVSLLLAILIADLLFFMLIRADYPEVFEAFLERLPWDDDLEEAVIVISGYIVAVLTSSATIYVLVKHFQRKAE